MPTHESAGATLVLVEPIVSPSFRRLQYRVQGACGTRAFSRKWKAFLPLKLRQQFGSSVFGGIFIMILLYEKRENQVRSRLQACRPAAAGRSTHDCGRAGVNFGRPVAECFFPPPRHRKRSVPPSSDASDDGEGKGRRKPAKQQYSIRKKQSRCVTWQTCFKACPGMLCWGSICIRDAKRSSWANAFVSPT